jgi:hypothetical protein
LELLEQRRGDLEKVDTFSLNKASIDESIDREGRLHHLASIRT